MSTTHPTAAPLDYQSPMPKSPAGPGTWILRIVIAVVLLVGALSMLMPSMCKSRESANRAKCASNLHQIGLAILLYTNDNHGRYPDSFATIMKYEQVNSAVFVCPSSNDGAADGDTPDAVAVNMAKPHHCSFVYLGTGLTLSTAKDDTLICYELPENHQNDGMNMLFGDGHSEWLMMSAAKDLIAKATAIRQTIAAAP